LLAEKLAKEMVLGEWRILLADFLNGEMPI